MLHFNTTRNITASISFVSKYGAHVNTSMNLNNLLLFWSSFLLRTNGLGQPTVGWSAQSSSELQTGPHAASHY